MALIEINKNPSKKELGWFGLMMAAFLGLVGLIALRRFDAPAVANALWIAGVVVPALYYVIPPIRKPVYLGWLYATYPIGFVISHLLLGTIFYIVFTAVGLLVRAFGRDPMTRELEPTSKTYWTEHRPCDAKPARYFRQY